MAREAFIIVDEKTDNTDSGTFTQAVWQTRDLNTVRINEISGASLSSNQFVLPAGTYEIYAKAVAKSVDSHQVRLRNITDSTTDAVGMNCRAEKITTGAETKLVNDNNSSSIRTKITIAGTKTFELQHRCESTQATDGFGDSSSPIADGEPEIYATVFIIKVDGDDDDNLLIVKNEQATTTAGGTFTLNTWTTRDLNTVEHNSITGASLASDQITLPAGDYEIIFEVEAHRVNFHKARFRNITDGTTALVSTGGWAEVESAGDFAVSSTDPIICYGYISIAAEKDFEIQHICRDTRSGNGLGVQTNFGEVEVYTQAMIRKLD